MAKFTLDNIEYEVPDGTCLAATCEKAGVPFSCNSGVCGTCQINILEGQENLNDLNQEEKDLAMDRNHRLGCQCVIVSGTVKAGF
jgi:ferredoxin